MFGHDNNTPQQDDNATAPMPDATLSDAGDSQPTGAPPTSLPPVGGDDAVTYSPDDTPAATPEPAAVPAPAEPDVATPQVAAPAPGSDDLLGIKQQALQQLSPLLGHLDQTPEEKFRTTMMLIQASDNQSLVSEAYEAAQKITDEKVRAQALLDIVNEINYFTQHSEAA
ncbi:MAG TPA: hypothetical protein VMY99_00605 [Nevskiaceae bacterium]|nr:hypothetical protein [Nevskiaceae bacterium]